jgi:hypothetical protein
MKIQLLSDLHLEANPGFVPRPAPGVDLLVLAGDIGSYQANSALTAAGDADFGLQRFSPLHGLPSCSSGPRQLEWGVGNWQLAALNTMWQAGWQLSEQNQVQVCRLECTPHHSCHPPTHPPTRPPTHPPPGCTPWGPG